VDNKQCLDSLTNRLVECNNDECISTIVSDFSEFVFTHAFHNCGVSYKHGNHRTKSNRKSTNTWFNRECAMARKDFCKARNAFLRHKSDVNRVLFVKCRSHFNAVKRKARANYKVDEGRKLAKLAKTNPRKF
jgi:hypothetical protein